MERVRVSASETVGITTVKMAVETETGVKRWVDRKALSVLGRVFQIEHVNGEYVGTDLATLEVVVLEMVVLK